MLGFSSTRRHIRTTTTRADLEVRGHRRVRLSSPTESCKKVFVMASIGKCYGCLLALKARKTDSACAYLHGGEARARKHAFSGVKLCASANPLASGLRHWHPRRSASLLGSIVQVWLAASLQLALNGDQEALEAHPETVFWAISRSVSPLFPRCASRKRPFLDGPLAASLTPLYVRLTQVMTTLEGRYEINLRRQRQPRRHAAASPRDLNRTRESRSSLCLRRNFGQTAALKAGFDAARGDIVISMGGDPSPPTISILRPPSLTFSGTERPGHSGHAQLSHGERHTRRRPR
jgi:hypothetical protein